jgi:hypothetical protein
MCWDPSRALNVLVSVRGNKLMGQDATRGHANREQQAAQGCADDADGKTAVPMLSRGEAKVCCACTSA